MRHHVEILNAVKRHAQQPFVKMKFKIRYMENDKAIHQVEVKSVNYQDVKRHLEAGEMVEIIPEFSGQATKHSDQDEKPYYITHI